VKPVRLTLHAEERRQQRGIASAWVESTARQPDWVLSELADPTVQRRFRAIAEHYRRILWVACVETDHEIRVITLMFDRNARKP